MNEVNEEYFSQKISQEIWKDKYKAKEDENIEDTWSRVSQYLAQNEKNKSEWADKFYDLLENFKFLPGGRITANADINKKGMTMLNCFVSSDIKDDIYSIMSVATESALVQKSGGGVGFNFSNLRPKGDIISTSGGKSSGPVSFMQIYNAVCSTIKSGNNRRGAMMAILSCDHPDIENFIKAKDHTGSDKNNLSNFNLSVQASDKFMKAVEKDDYFELKFKGHVYKRIKAREIWDKLMRNTYEVGEPGIQFLDTAEKLNNLWWVEDEKITASNPCGEQLLPHSGSCLLGSFNLTQYVKNPFGDDSFFDIDKFSSDVKTAVRMMDNVIDTTEYPAGNFELKEKKTRRIGLGITGFGDACFMLKIKYGNNGDCLGLIHQIGASLRDSSYEASALLAKEKGCCRAVENEEDKKNFLQGKFVKRLPQSIKKIIAKNGIRNSFLTTIAPVGTGSLMANNISSGIEPIFAGEYQRQIKNINDNSIKTENVMDYALFLLKKEFESKFESMTDFWTIAEELKIDDFIETQSAWQQYIDNSISRTINIKTDFPFESFQDVYMKAWKRGLKGVTTFRPNEKAEGIFRSGGLQSEVKTKKKREDILSGKTYKFKSREGIGFYITINDYEEKPFEIFCSTKSPQQPLYSFIARLLSALLRKEEDYDYILEEMEDTEVANEGFWMKNGRGYAKSVISAIGKILKGHIKKEQPIKVSIVNENREEIEKLCLLKCPDCGAPSLNKSGNCETCLSCGYSKCS